jgi:hypothetical protein
MKKVRGGKGQACCRNGGNLAIFRLMTNRAAVQAHAEAQFITSRAESF